MILRLKPLDNIQIAAFIAAILFLALLPSAVLAEELITPSGTITINNGSQFTKNRDVSVAILASDEGPPIHKVKLANSIAELAAAEWQDFFPVASWSLSEGDGDKIIYAKFKDLAEEESEIAAASINLDQTAPLVTAGLDRSTNKAFVQAGSARDSNEIASYYWKKVLGPGDLVLTSPDKSATSILATIDGRYRIRLTVTDVAGNSSYSTMTLIWDNAKPLFETIDAPAPGTHIRRALIIKGTAADQKLITPSGIKDVKLYKGLKRLSTSTNRIFTFKFDTTTIGNGKHQFRIITTDRAGNTKEWSRYYTIDNAKPGIPYMYISPLNPAKSTDAVVSFKVTDNLSPKVSTKLQITTNTGSVWRSFDLGARSKDIILSKSITMRGIAGSYIYKVIATDRAGNQQIRQLTFNVAETWDAAKIRSHVNQLAGGIGPREAGTSNEQRASEYIKSELIKYGYAVQQQSFKLPNGRISYNMIGSRPGYTAGKMIILGAHYDSKAGSPGANDNASGTALLLELAKYYRYKNTNAGLTFAFFGSEEKVGTNPANHHFGSRHYVRSMSALDKSHIIEMINIDMIGVGTVFNIRSMQRGPMTLVNEMLSYARSNRYGLYFLKDTGRTGMGDHEPFELAGIPVAWLQWRSDPNYHTKNDTYSRIQWSRVDTTANFVNGFLKGK